MEEYVKKREKPKEWYAYESTSDHCWKVRDENGIIAKVGGNFQTDIEEANAARLIAASKEMLSALESIENDDNSIPDAIWQMRCNAILKAKNGLKGQCIECGRIDPCDGCLDFC